MERMRSFSLNFASEKINRLNMFMNKSKFLSRLGPSNSLLCFGEILKSILFQIF